MQKDSFGKICARMPGVRSVPTMGRDGTGRDGTGQDRTGRDGAGRDGARQGGTGRGGTGRDGAGRGDSKADARFCFAVLVYEFLVQEKTPLEMHVLN